MKIRDTYSLCPVCLKKIPAALTQKEDNIIYLEKECPEHGSFHVPVWKNHFDYAEWISAEEPLSEEAAQNCSGDCRVCGAHSQGTCCVILEVTRSCNLRCTYCFAQGGEHQDMPSTESLKRDIERITELAGDPMLQLAGGEPTLRDDLPELIRFAKEAGCSYTQVNTNGIRLAEDEAYVEALAKAGLDIVFLQFDGADDEICQKLRGRDLTEIKLKAIQNCDKYHIGVTLVPTIVRGINDDRIGDIVRVALKLFPAVRSIHFQPVTYLGRYPDRPEAEDRYTLDELMHDIVEQTGIPESVFLPSRCDHAACEFHSTFIISEDGAVIPMTNRTATVRKQRTSPAENRRSVAEHWKRAEGDHTQASVDPEVSVMSGQRKPIVFGNTDGWDFDTILRYMKTRSLKISAMAFQDAMNIDLERLGRCSLHVYENGKLIPFCGKYLTPIPHE